MKSKIILKNKTILVTGAAGFIGANLVMSLLQEENPLQIIGID
ncbi:TPA: NAD-dependent epimerase/dehydratase family protein, partial [Streptococcus pneumoniae]